MATNILDLFDHMQKQGEMGRQRGQENRLASLYQKAYTAPQSERQGYIGQMAGVDPASAMSADKAFSQSDDDGMSRLAQKAAMFVGMAEGGNEAVVAGMYPQIAAEARRLGLGDIPDQYDPSFLPGLKQFAQYANRGSASGIQSTYVDAQGNRVGIMRDGRTQILGQNAPSNQIIDTGNGFYGVNKGNLQAAPVMIGGQQQAPQQQQPQMQPGTRQISNFQASATNLGDGSTLDFSQLPQDEQAAFLQSLQTGGTVNLPPAQGGGQQLRSTPSPTEQNKQTRRMSPQEVRAAGYRDGTIVQVDGYGNERVVQQPNQASQSMSAAERKNILAAKAKVPQLQNAIRGLGRIDDALAKLNMPGINTGPLDQYAVRNLPAGQELEAAVGGIQNSFLALTRVPGIGSQSDLEARIAALQYPSLDKAPEVNRRTMENLKLFARDLAKAYESAVTQGVESTTPDATIDDTADDVDDLLNKYGAN